jgi:hypothetical protein
MMEALRSTEMLVVIKATRRNIAEDGFLHSHRREDLKSYIALTGWAVQRRRKMFPVRYELGCYIHKTTLFTVRFLTSSYYWSLTIVRKSLSYVLTVTSLLSPMGRITFQLISWTVRQDAWRERLGVLFLTHYNRAKKEHQSPWHTDHLYCASINISPSTLPHAKESIT